MRYSDIVGQREALGRLSRMVKDQRVPHALLFVGKDGSGPLPAAFAFASHLFCKAPVGDGPCGSCASCLKTRSLGHPDLHVVFPIIKSKAVASSDDVASLFRDAFSQDPYLTSEQWTGEMDPGNKQPVIPVEESSAILRKLSYTSYEGSYKVMVIWQPEKMNAESANKLLKILEEPPEKTVFILVSATPDQLLPTIISRVQKVPFYDCREDEIADALVKQFHVTREAALQAALLADGSYAAAVAALSQADEGVTLISQFQAFMRLAFKPDGLKTAQWIDEHAGTGREKQKQFLQYGLQVLRDCLMYNYGDKSLVKLSGTERQFLEKFAPFVSKKNYEALVEEFNNNYYYIERNANPKILFMDLLLKCHDLLRNK